MKNSYQSNSSGCQINLQPFMNLLKRFLTNKDFDLDLRVRVVKCYVSMEDVIVWKMKVVIINSHDELNGGL